MKLFIFSFLSLFGVLIASAQINDVYYVKSEKLNLRVAASTASKSLGLLSKGDELLVLDFDKDWYKVEFGEYQGWVNKDFLEPKKENSYRSLNLQTGDSPECSNMEWRYDYEAKGRLYITAGRGSDFAVKLMDKHSDVCIRAFYIRSGESIIVKDIPQSIYYLKIANGLDYRQGLEQGKCIMVFNRNSNYQIAKDILDFNLGKKRVEKHNGEDFEVQDVPSYSLSLAVPRNSRDDKAKNLDSRRISEKEFNQ